MVRIIIDPVLEDLWYNACDGTSRRLSDASRINSSEDEGKYGRQLHVAR